MSVTYIEHRTCDVCKKAFDTSIQSWMTMVAPNLEESTEFDFCAWECLHGWVNTDDEELPEPQAEPGVTITHDEAAQVRLDKAMAQIEQAMGDKPPMSLAEAIASGKMDFNRGPE